MSPASFVHLVGSVPLDSAEEVMQAMCRSLPRRIYRVPDGETGERNLFVLWQAKKFWPSEVLSFRPPWMNIPVPEETSEKYELKKEALPPTTGYAEHALSSYQVFCRLRDSGIIPHGVKFQVCLPSPATAAALLLVPEYKVKGEQLFEQVLNADLKTIQDKIPHHDLAIQWDILAEVVFLEHVNGNAREADPWFYNQLIPFFEPVREGLGTRMTRLALPVHPDVDMGLHLCYGDAKREHFVQPLDAGVVTEMANICIENMSHRVDWVHVPVPKGRHDEAYFKPLNSLDLGQTSLILGLVHANDDQGTKERLTAAHTAMGHVKFGIRRNVDLGEGRRRS